MEVALNINGYCPISIKEQNNKPNINVFDEMTNADIFLSKKNIDHVVYTVMKLNEANKNNNNMDNIKQIPNYMLNWSNRENINDFEYVYDDILLVLQFLNNKFLNDNSFLFDMVSNNIFKVKDTVLENGNKTKKKYNEMTADDYKTLDVWQEQNVFVYNNINRYKNTIPIWQKSMNVRHFERESEGLHAYNADRASLDNQVRGYDMSNIIKGSVFYENNFYENI